MTVAELIPKMSQEEWAKCRQILRLCVASLMVADVAEELASKHEALPLAELYDAVGRIHPELRDVATRLLNNIIDRIAKFELLDSDEAKYFVYRREHVRLEPKDEAEWKRLILRYSTPVAVMREGLLKIADDVRIIHNILCF